MAGRITVNAGPAPVVLTGLDATNATVAYADYGLTTPVPLPLTVQQYSAVTLYCTDSASITPTVKDPTLAHTLSAVATACRDGRPVALGPFAYTGSIAVA